MDTPEVLEQKPSENGQELGFVYQSLNRSNKQIRKDRGDAIAEDLEVAFKRDVEDLRMDLKRLMRDRENMYDFSPESSYSLVLKKDVDSREILLKDKKISLEIRELEITLEIMEKRYIDLFGKKA